MEIRHCVWPPRAARAATRAAVTAAGPSRHITGGPKSGGASEERGCLGCYLGCRLRVVLQARPRQASVGARGMGKHTSTRHPRNMDSVSSGRTVAVMRIQ